MCFSIPSQIAVTTGRFLSLLAYYALFMVIFHWLQEQFQNRWLAFLASIILMLQFPVWSFSFQARGYELYLLMQWCVYLSLFQLFKIWQ